MGGTRQEKEAHNKQNDKIIIAVYTVGNPMGESARIIGSLRGHTHTNRVDHLNSSHFGTRLKHFTNTIEPSVY